MLEEYDYNNIDEVMLSLCKCYDEAATSSMLGLGMRQYWRRQARYLKEYYFISKRAEKMLKRNLDEFLRQPQDRFYSAAVSE